MPPFRFRSAALAASACLTCLAGASHAADASPTADTPKVQPTEDFNLHLQATYIRQQKNAFQAPYSGLNSLSPDKERSYSFTSTIYLGARLGPQTELYFNPEFVQGIPLSRLAGLGGPTNSELQKTAGAELVGYRARLFMRHTWGLGGGSDYEQSDANQLAGSYDKRRVTLTIGNFAASDLFDNNKYAHDGRTYFMNWALLTHGAYDFAADSRGYSWGAALEYRHGDDWTLRAGRFMQPRESNGLPLDRHIFSHYGDQVELEHNHMLGDRPGTLRLLAFRNVAIMGSFADALAYAAQNGSAPDLAAVRERHAKVGAGVNLEQEVADDVGVFARIARNSGKYEAYAFAEIDKSFSAGAHIGGSRWGRARDHIGVAYAQNGLSSSHRSYLAAGGYGFFVGDGRLNYRPEGIAELYYSFGFKGLSDLPNNISVGFQHIRNPGYNADRGPVNVLSARFHAEF